LALRFMNAILTACIVKNTNWRIWSTVDMEMVVVYFR